MQTLLGKYQELRDAVAAGATAGTAGGSAAQAEEESDCAYLLEEIPKALTQTLEGVTRVATIVRAMKEFAHPEGKEMAAADLNKALLSTLTVARNELKYVADVETGFRRPAAGGLQCRGHEPGFSEPPGERRPLDRGRGERDREERQDTSAHELEGPMALITIADTGAGIPEAIQSRIFDPFFTTKEVGRGTGQGLAIARSVVVDHHKGSLTFDSEVGKGTTFFIRFPLKPAERSQERSST